MLRLNVQKLRIFGVLGAEVLVSTVSNDHVPLMSPFLNSVARNSLRVNPLVLDGFVKKSSSGR